MRVDSKIKRRTTFSRNKIKWVKKANIKIKWVKKANMWCRSYWGEDNKLHQEWTTEKPKEENETQINSETN